MSASQQLAPGELPASVVAAHTIVPWAWWPTAHLTETVA